MINSIENGETVSIDTSELGIDDFITYGGYTENNRYKILLPCTDNSSAEYQLYIYFDKQSNVLYVTAGSRFLGTKVFLFIEYSKIPS